MRLKDILINKHWPPDGWVTNGNLETAASIPAHPEDFTVIAIKAYPEGIKIIVREEHSLMRDEYATIVGLQDNLDSRQVENLLKRFESKSLREMQEADLTAKSFA